MGKKITLGTAITLIIIAVAITVSLTMVLALRNFNEKVSGITERENMFAKFTEIDNYVRQNRSDIDEETLMDGVAKGYLSGINDPYALYMSAETYSAYVAASSQTVAGVGITASMDSDGYMLVGKVYEGSTAASAATLSSKWTTSTFPQTPMPNLKHCLSAKRAPRLLLRFAATVRTPKWR